MKNKPVIILIVVLAFLTGMLISRKILFTDQNLALVSSEPNIFQDNVNPNLEKITFQFNQSLDKTNLSVSIIPDLQHQIKKETNNLIIFPEEVLKEGERYQIEIREVSGDFYFPFSFQTGSGLSDPAEQETGFQSEID
ncbi:MAG: hypothetical protein PHX72_00115 [Candidatus Shapirobacteria bacterium]|nr:hypothetical protein [Candidatus Shapirobacteria bacterium]